MRTRTIALLAVALLALGACSDGDDAADGGGGAASGAGGADGGGAAFCEVLASSDDLDLNEDAEEAAAAMAAMRAAAPDELRDDVDLLLGAVEELAGLDEDDPEAFSEAMALVFDPAFVAAGERLEAYGAEECGIEPSDDLDGDFGDDFDFDDDFGDDFDFDDDLGSSDGLDIDKLQAHIDDGYAGESWAEDIASWSVANEQIVEVGPFSGTFSDEDALAVCAALSEVAFDLEPDAEVTVTSSDGDPIASRGADDEACALV